MAYGVVDCRDIADVLGMIASQAISDLNIHTTTPDEIHDVIADAARRYDQAANTGNVEGSLGALGITSDIGNYLDKFEGT